MKRNAMAMIELIFAIVVIAISVVTIPSMMNVADRASETVIVDEDVLMRMMGEIVKVSKARWDEHYVDNTSSGDARFLILQNGGNCTADSNGTLRPANPYSSAVCQADPAISAPSAIPSPGDLNLSKGIEQLNGKNYTLTLEGTGGTYTVPVTYAVSYVNANNTWTLGSSGSMPSGGGVTHMKRVVVRVNDPARGVDTTLTFFKSNIGKF